MEKWKTAFDLPRLIQAGAFFFGVAVAALAAQNLLGTDPEPGAGLLPPILAGRPAWTVINGAVLLCMGLSVAGRKHAEFGAVALGSLLLLWVAAWHVPRLFADPHSGDEWTVASEALAIGGAAWVLAGRGSSTMLSDEKFLFLPDWIPRLGRYGYGLTLPVFGALHLIYWQYVTSLIPVWVPKPLFWTCFTAVAFFAAGAGMLTGIGARLAATWTGVMFLGWVLMLHVPRVEAHFADVSERSSLLVALAMGGGAWIIAQDLTTKPPGTDTPKSAPSPRFSHFN